MNYSAKKGASDTKATRMRISELEGSRDMQADFKGEEKFWLIENKHLNNVVEEQCLQLEQLQAELNANRFDRKALEEIRRNN